MPKLKSLDKIIKSHFRRCCPLCGCSLYSEVIDTTRGKQRKVNSRSFSCTNCTASYLYERVGSHFKISKFQYTIDKYEIECTYDKIGFKIIYDPEPENKYVDNTVLVESDKEIPFPSTKEKLEDRLFTYMTFS